MRASAESACRVIVLDRFKKCMAQNVEIYMNIYVGNLAYEVDDRKLEELFGEHGSVSSARVIMDRDSGRSKGFGFVEMPDDSEASNAIEALNEFDVGGRPLRVNEARARN